MCSSSIVRSSDTLHFEGARFVCFPDEEMLLVRERLQIGYSTGACVGSSAMDQSEYIKGLVVRPSYVSCQRKVRTEATFAGHILNTAFGVPTVNLLFFLGLLTPLEVFHQALGYPFGGWNGLMAIAARCALGSHFDAVTLTEKPVVFIQGDG